MSRRPRVIFKLAVAMCSWPLRESLSVLIDFTVFDVAQSSFAQLEKSIGHDVFCAVHSAALFGPSFQNDLILQNHSLLCVCMCCRDVFAHHREVVEM